MRSSALLAGVAAVALAGGAGVAYAATHGSSPASARTASAAIASPSPSPSSPALPEPGKRVHTWFGLPGFGLPGIGVGALGVVHGQLTVPKQGGGYQTVDVQSGTVTAVNSTSITVRSADGFVATYTVTGSTEVNAEAAGIGAVKTGDTVFVTATTSGGSATAASITDISSIRASRGAFGFPTRPAG